jgi:hypothetical protein
MRFIAHRGNINGPSTDGRDNNPEQILHALQSGFDVEIDVHSVDDRLHRLQIGHDHATYDLISLVYTEYKYRLWCHAKNIKALHQLLKIGLNCFMHDKDDATLTSAGYIWTYPGQPLTDKSICVLPQFSPAGRPEQPEIWDCHGICSDYVQSLKEIYDETIKSKRTE